MKKTFELEDKQKVEKIDVNKNKYCIGDDVFLKKGTFMHEMFEEANFLNIKNEEYKEMLTNFVNKLGINENLTTRDKNKTNNLLIDFKHAEDTITNLEKDKDNLQNKIKDLSLKFHYYSIIRDKLNLCK